MLHEVSDECHGMKCSELVDLTRGMLCCTKVAISSTHRANNYKKEKFKKLSYEDLEPLESVYADILTSFQ